jgi:hypothetical protein
MYNGGPEVSAFAGNVPLSVGDSQNLADYWTVAVGNNKNGAFQQSFERFFNMRDLGLLLPSSGSPTIPNSLTT